MYKSTYPDAAFVCGSDKNDLSVHLLLDIHIHPTFKQLVTLPTYRNSVLDVIVSDIGQYYQVPIIRPPVAPDNPTSASVSDHRIAFARTISTSTTSVCRVTSSRTVRPLPNSSVQKFANWVQREPWTFVFDGVDASDMVERFNFLMQLSLDTYCPSKTVKFTNLDGKISCPVLKQACRRKKREYMGIVTGIRYSKRRLKTDYVKLQLNSFKNKQSRYPTTTVGSGM